MTRYRLRWSRRGKLRYLSANDIASVLERAVRRAQLPLAYSRGFSPHPKISFATALPVGYGSDVELLDMTLTEALDPTEIQHRFNTSLPDGVRIEGVALLSVGTAKLGDAVVAADYVIDHRAAWLPDVLERFMALESYEFARSFKGSTRTDDLRAGVFEAVSRGSRIEMRCALSPRAVRPTDVISALGRIAHRDTPHVTVERIALLVQGNASLVAIDERGVMEMAT